MKQTIIQQIRNGNERVFLDIYKNYRNVFIKSATFRFGCTAEEAKDAFQDAMYSFHQNIMNGKLEVLTVTIEQYLWKIAGYRLITLKKRQKKERDLIGLLVTDLKQINSPLYSNEKDAQLLLQLIHKLRPKDQKLLTLRYYYNYCMEAIACELGYQNAQVVRNRKGKIINKLAVDFKAIKKKSKIKLTEVEA